VESEAKQREYTAEAKAAEDAATKAPDSDTRETWLKIAEQYRELAKLG